MTLNNKNVLYDSTRYTQTRIYNNKAIHNFKLQLSHGCWDNVFGSNCVNEIFNNFLNTYLQCYYANFTRVTMKRQHKFQNWMTIGIKISCKRKRELSLLCRYSNDHTLKLDYNKIILNSENKTMTTWKIINYEKGKFTSHNDAITLKIDNNNVTDPSIVANLFNTYFLSITDSVNMEENKHSG